MTSEALASNFVGNVFILGYDSTITGSGTGTVPSRMGMQAQQVKVNGDMFKTANVKGMELILYFLLTRFDPKFKEELRGVWPIFEKEQAKQFKQVVFKKLETIEKETDPTARFVPYHSNTSVRLSLLNTCSGDRFYQLVWYLSQHVIRKVLSAEFKCPVPPLLNICQDTAKLTTSACAQRTLKIFCGSRQTCFGCQAAMAAILPSARSRISRFEEATGKVVGIHTEANQMEVKKDQTNGRLYHTEGSMTNPESHKLEQIRNIWKVLHECHQKDTHRKDAISSITHRRPGSSVHRLDPKDFVNVDPKLNDKLNVSSLVNLWAQSTAALQAHLHGSFTYDSYLTKLDSRKPVDFRITKTMLTEYLNDHHKLLQSIRTLNDVVLEEIAILQRSVNTLQDVVCGEIPLVKVSSNKKQSKSEAFQPVPPTPAHSLHFPHTQTEDSQ